MLYTFSKSDTLPAIPFTRGLEIRENYDPLFMSIISQISLEESTRRMANDNKAYVAYVDNVPAAFGWMAMGKARIGELNHEFILPLDHRYLWNFRTLSEFRGRGIYVHLLQFILAEERHRTNCFWIMHAPENRSSERGIVKAGFKLKGKVSVVNGNEVIFNSAEEAIHLGEVLNTFGFTRSEEEPASCWNCSSPYLKSRKPECCCLAAESECTRNLFTTV